MNQGQAKASQRQIRRAFGAQAIRLLDQHAEAINQHGHDLTHLRSDVAALARELAILKRATVGALDDERKLRASLSRSLLRRVRWLVTGR